MGATVKTLWILFIAGQILNAGNMNYQQEHGYYEINDGIYGEHPSKGRVYTVKVLETLAVYGATRIFPRHEEAIVAGASGFVWGFIYYDNKRGIDLKFRW